jgi:hypothetical protein
LVKKQKILVAEKGATQRYLKSYFQTEDAGIFTVREILWNS